MSYSGLLTGTPGLYNWVGGGEQSQLQDIFVENPVFLPKTKVESEHETSFMGYSLILCDMADLGALTIVGGPRGNRYSGQVLFL